MATSPETTTTTSHATALSTLDKRANHCFGCGPDNPSGLHLTFTVDTGTNARPTASAQATFDRRYEGPPGYLHGGIIATLLDEAMSKLNRPLGLIAVTRNMQIDYRRPVPLNQPLTVTGHHLRREGRKLFHRAEITLANGTVLAEAQGLFIAIDEKLLAAAGLTPPTEETA
ncbi:MAG: PaaI family thioesterase [Edaphobacter sp.]|uniref:PaaI family thioesterase n=1 Tax=Edaphobacter sp. TaxID=1934404 RepID=UPI0023891125|nr:PaaI family thioesterase [Edaphobacter sp.]MDE1175471.1 PaaI family thioesterase [Edaphobacter sp.]